VRLPPESSLMLGLDSPPPPETISPIDSHKQHIPPFFTRDTYNPPFTLDVPNLLCCPPGFDEQVFLPVLNSLTPFLTFTDAVQASELHFHSFLHSRAPVPGNSIPTHMVSSFTSLFFSSPIQLISSTAKALRELDSSSLPPVFCCPI